MKNTGSGLITYIAYVLLLVSFLSLGIFVAALALGSSTAGALAIVMASCLTASVIGFRAAAARRARAAEEAGSRYKLSIWTNALHPHEVEQYRLTYRGMGEETEVQAASPTVATAPAGPASAGRQQLKAA